MNILTIEDLHAAVPAAFAEEPADNVSHRYSFIPTSPIIDEVMARGWYPTKAHQSRRVADQRHATHMISFRQPDQTIKVGDVLPEVTIINNHSAAKMFRFVAGFFRLVCSNGLMIGTGIAETKVVRIHIDGASVNLDSVFQGAMSKIDEAISQIAKWQQIDLNFVQRQDFASKAVLIKNNNDPYWSAHYDAHEFLTTRRPEDQRHDLWTTFNIVQENILKGEVQGPSRMTKPITQVSEVQRINQQLWQLTTEYGKLHGVN